MPRRPAHTPLNAFINGRHVGTLRRASSGGIDFRYDRSWLDWSATFPISLSLPLREDRYIGGMVSNVFDNLLPDSDAIRRRIAERVGAAGADAYSLLTALGHDCVGALQFLPDGSDPGPAGAADGRPVTDDDVAGIIANLGSTPLGMDEDAGFRISIAGAQEKTALLRRNGAWLRPTGTSATTHILKPQIGVLPNGVDLSDSVENEYLCLKLMAAFGVPAATAEMADFGGRRTLVVERFDRLWARDGRLLRLPQEDCCQALSVPPTLKYEAEGGPGMREIVALLKASDRPDEDIFAFMRANVAFWLLGATDGHAKNFSIFLKPGGRFRMTPLYDVLTAQPSLDRDRSSLKTFKLAMSVGTNRHYRIDRIAPRHFLQSAAGAGFDEVAMRSIMQDLAESAGRLATDVVNGLPSLFPERLTTSVLAGVRRRADVLGRVGTR